MVCLAGLGIMLGFARAGALDIKSRRGIVAYILVPMTVNFGSLPTVTTDSSYLLNHPRLPMEKTAIPRS